MRPVSPMRLRAVNIVLLDMKCRGRAHPGTAGRDHLTRFAGTAAHPPLTRHRHDVRGPHLHAFGRDAPFRRRTVDLRSAGADQFARAHDSQDHPLQGPPGVRTAGICLHLEQQLRNLLRAPICPRSCPAGCEWGASERPETRKPRLAGLFAVFVDFFGSHKTYLWRSERTSHWH